MEKIETKDIKEIENLREAYKKIIAEMKKVIIGQEEVIKQILICLFARGHAILVGVPGLAKTLIIKSISQIFALKFSRIQFTPDLMPSDITGTNIIEDDHSTGKRRFRFIPGPVFANIILADEINRTPPKTQAALLESMQEYRVTVGETTYSLELPFFVLATQNPIEFEGTYPLPEAQLDRFMFQINIDYPPKEEEKKIIELTTSEYEPSINKLLTSQDIQGIQKIVRSFPIAEPVVDYATRLIRATRPDEPGSPKFIKDWVKWGVGPRAGQYLILGAKVNSILEGRFAVSKKDIESVIYPVFRHRLLLNYIAEAEDIKVDTVIKKLLEEIKE